MNTTAPNWDDDLKKAKELAERLGYEWKDFTFEKPSDYGNGKPVLATFLPSGLKRAFPAGPKTFANTWLNFFKYDLETHRFRDVQGSLYSDRDARIEMLRQNSELVLQDCEIENERRLRVWERKYDNRVSYSTEQQRNLVSLAMLGMKAASILNAGAILAVLQFIHKVGDEYTPQGLGYAIEIFLFGVFFAFALLLLAYKAQFYYAQFLGATVRAQKIGNRKVGDIMRIAALTCAFGSGLCFLIGGEMALNVILGNKSYVLQIWHFLSHFTCRMCP